MMQIRKSPIVSVLVALGAIWTSQAFPAESRQAAAMQVGVLKNISLPGCGCYFGPEVSGANLASEKYLFISDATGKAYVNLDGRDVELKEVGRKQAKDEFGYCAEKRCTFSGNGVMVTVDLREAKKCPPEPTECEVTDYLATITVNKGGAKRIVKGQGSCGC